MPFTVAADHLRRVARAAAGFQVFGLRWLTPWVYYCLSPLLNRVRPGSVVRLSGFDVRLGQGDLYTFANLFEDYPVDLLRRAICDVDLVIDLGANVGAFSFLIETLSRDAGRKLSIMAVEPNTANVSFLRQQPFAGSLTTSFLLRGVGFTQTEVGAINKGLGLVATIVGALAGGAWLSSRPLYNALMLFGILQAVSNFGYWLLAVLPKSYALMAAAIGVENLCGGLGTAAFVAFLMALTDMRYSAAQYALLSALAAVGRVYVGPASGVMVESFGWPSFFMLTVVAALPGLLLLRWLRSDVRTLGAVKLGASVDD